MDKVKFPLVTELSNNCLRVVSGHICVSQIIAAKIHVVIKLTSNDLVFHVVKIVSVQISHKI